MTVPVIDNARARHIFLSRHGLAAAPIGAGRGDDLAGFVGNLGFFQLDSVNTFARAHDLILWSRRQQYRPKALGHALAHNRHVFEYWTHDAAAIDMALFPHWRHKFARDGARLEGRWKAWRRDDFSQKIDDVLRQISIMVNAGLAMLARARTVVRAAGGIGTRPRQHWSICGALGSCRWSAAIIFARFMI